MSSNTNQPGRRRVPIKAGAGVVIPLNSGIRTTRVTLGGRTTGNVVLTVKPYLTTDEATNYTQYSPSEFEAVSNGTVDLSSNSKTRAFNLELSAIRVDDTGNTGSDFWIEIHAV